MAVITGKGGCVKISETALVNITDWTADYTADIFDVTGMADTAPTHKAQVAGLKSMTGSFTGNLTGAADGILGILTVGSTVDLWLETDGTDKYDIPTAIITGISTSVAVGGQAQATGSFISNGDVTPSYS